MSKITFNLFLLPVTRRFTDRGERIIASHMFRSQFETREEDKAKKRIYQGFNVMERFTAEMKTEVVSTKDCLNQLLLGNHNLLFSLSLAIEYYIPCKKKILLQKAINLCMKKLNVQISHH